MTGNTSNHHRYGEVKTRLTIGDADDFGRIAGFDRPDGEGSEPRLPLRQPLKGRHALRYVVVGLLVDGVDRNLWAVEQGWIVEGAHLEDDTG